MVERHALWICHLRIAPAESQLLLIFRRRIMELHYLVSVES
jgi:hypothetical protein